MTSSYKDSVGDYYQIEDGAQGAGSVSVESELIDFITGIELVDGDTSETLTGETLESLVLSTRENIQSIVIANDEDLPVTINPINETESEVSVSLLGIPREEVALNLFDTVNIYGVNDKEWVSSVSYSYDQDPSAWTNRADPNGTLYGNYAGHIANQSAIRAYSYPPPVSFTYPVDDNSGRFPGGNTNGAMTAEWTSRRAFRYQPGRVTGFTLGVRVSTQTNVNGEVVEWGCKNDIGDGYFFRLEKGADFSIVRTSPDLGTLVVPRSQWNGDKVLVNEGLTQWGLDLSRVTMFKIEFSWYGAVGAKFLAYVPAGNGEARWVVLHYIFAENLFTVPSLRSPYLRMFISTRSVAGATKPSFIYLYGSSVYIDGGDKGTVTCGAATLAAPKNITSTSRSLIGLNVKGSINGVTNQKTVYPVSLSAYASVPTRIDLIFRNNSLCTGVQYGYAAGTSLFRGSSATYTGTVTGTFEFTISSGQFPDISNELGASSFPTYLTQRRVKVNGAGVFATHAVDINPGLTTITVDRTLPPSLSSISLSRLNAYAVSDATLTSGVTNGVVYRKDDGGYWRLGLWPQASGVYDGTQPVAWFASAYPGLTFDASTGLPNGENKRPFGCNEVSTFTVTDNTVSSVSAGGSTVTVSGSPWPIAVVAELMDGATISNIVVGEGDFGSVDEGATIALTGFTVSGVSQSAPTGGTDYIAHKFEDALADPLSAVLVDRQGSYTMPTDNRVATYFLGADETKTFSLSNVFGPDKMFIAGSPGTFFNTGGLFVVATARAGSGIASAMLNWEEQ